MKIEIQITNDPIRSRGLSENYPAGAIAEFSGVVRDLENGEKISALEYESYSPMAENEMRRILASLAEKFPCLSARVIHRIGIIPVGETAIYVCIAAKHRGEAFAVLAEFMNRLKQDVPIWKRRGVPAGSSAFRRPEPAKAGTPNKNVIRSLDEAMAEIQSRCLPLPAVRISLAEAFGRVLREIICAPSDLPDCDRSTRDGYAILRDDVSETFLVVDTLHAADWKPRQIRPGQAVRVATGAALPCENLRVVVQENVERTGDQLRIIRRETVRNVSVRGEDLRAGEPVLHAGARLDAGALALLATAGKANPLGSPRLRVAHFTTGDEIILPEQTPAPGQVRDSNSFLIRGLLQQFPCDLAQQHLPENFGQAKSQIGNRQSAIGNADLLLFSGGASVGEMDFTRPLLEWLGFEIVFSQINLRPGRPLIFGVNGPRVAFGLPGNPLSHFVCFHFAVATALAHLTGGKPPKFLRGHLAEKLDDKPCPRETLWPARLKIGPDATVRLHPLAWANSGNLACLASANALVRVPANTGPLEQLAKVDFLPVAAMLGA